MEWTHTPLGGATVALLLGLLLGLERQRAKKGAAFAGIRTFPLFAVCGFFGALAGLKGIPWALPAVLLIVGGFGIAAYVREPEAGTGVTTEMTGLLVAVLGAVVALGEPAAAAAVAVLATLLLTLKAPLHRMAGAISEDEILAAMKFAVVAVVILPLLPDRPMGPYGALVPRNVGLLVVLLSGVGLFGYVLVKLLGGRAGWAIAGALGGLVSSTATTLSFAGKAREAAEQARALAVGVILASTVLYVRGGVVIALLDRELAAHLAPRLGVLFAVGLLAAALLYRRPRGEREDGVSFGNPVELGRAVALAAIFAVVIVLARVAQERLGTAGLWVVGALGGLVDVDSVAVASARVRQDGAAALPAAAGAYLLATVTNLLFKAGAVLATGGRELARRVLPAFGALAAATGALLVAWP
ncbi:MAG TPA: MgtC/SapB family protein [Vicinamibacteria bacterium]